MPQNTPSDTQGKTAALFPENPGGSDGGTATAAASPGSESGVAGQPPVAEAIQRASDAAVAGDVHQRRRPGQRGPDKGPRKRKVPVGSLGDGPPPASLEDARQAVLPVDFEPTAQSVDTAATEKIVAGVVQQLNAGVGAVVYLLGLRWIGDKDVAKAARESAEMSEEEKQSLTSSGAYMWQKYLGTLTDPKEAGFYIVLAGWLGLKVGGSVLSLYQAGQARKAQTAHLPTNTVPLA